MIVSKIHWLLSFILLSISCNNQNKENNSQNITINNLFLKYNEWRQNEINLGNFSDRCLPMDSIEFLTNRYALPKISDFDTTYYDIKEIDTSSFFYNNDTLLDYLFTIRPRDCENGTGIFSQHPPTYLLMLTDGNNFTIDNSVLKNVEKSLNNFFNNINGFYANRLYFDKIYKLDGENMLDGYFLVWLEDDANCCPSIEAEFKVYLPTSTNQGIIEIQGIIITGQETEAKEVFKKRLVLSK